MFNASSLAPLLIFAAASLLSAAPPGESAEADRVLDELDAALAKQGLTRTRVTYSSKELEVSGTLTLSYAPELRRMLIKRRQTSPRPEQSSMLFEEGSTTFWGTTGAQRYLYDLGPLVDGLYAVQVAISDPAAAPLTREVFARSLFAQIRIGIGVHAMGTRPTLVVALGTSTRSRASWIAEIREREDRTLTWNAKEVQVELPGGKTYVLDRATGFFLRQRQVLQHSTFTLEATPTQALKSFPDDTPPATTPVTELPVHQFVNVLRDMVLEASDLVGNGAEGKALERAAKASTTLAACAAHARLHHLARSDSRRFLRTKLARGATLATIEASLADLAAELANHLALAASGIEREEERELQTLRKAILSRVKAGSPEATALSAALSSERVRAARPKPATAKSHLEAVLETLR